MRRNLLALNERALRIAAEEAYRSEVVDTEMQELIIGEDKEYADRDEWIVMKMEEWLRKAGEKASR